MEERYHEWVERVCAWGEKVGPEVNLPFGTMQSPPALDGKCEILLLGHDANETNESNESNGFKGANKSRFFTGNPYWNTRDKWRIWSRPYVSVCRIGAKELLSEGNFMMMNLFYFTGRSISAVNRKFNQEIREKQVDFTDELVHNIVKPQVIVCFSVGSVFNVLRRRMNDVQVVKLDEKVAIWQGYWNGIRVIGMKHPSYRALSNAYLDAVFGYVTKLIKK